MNQDFDSDDLSEKILGRAVKDYFDMMEKSWGIRNPSDVMRECIKNKEWFKGVVLSATFLESVGAKVLSLHFGSQINPKRIRRLNLETIVILLYASRIIEHSTYLKMVEVRKYRNDMVHLKQSPFTEPKPQGIHSKRIIETAIRCLDKLLQEELLLESINQNKK